MCLGLPGAQQPRSKLGSLRQLLITAVVTPGILAGIFLALNPAGLHCTQHVRGKMITIKTLYDYAAQGEFLFFFLSEGAFRVIGLPVNWMDTLH